MLQVEGEAFFQERIVLSVLTGKSVRIKQIRTDSDNPGLLECEISFLRLIEKLTEGTEIDINHTGTGVVFKPGILKGGEVDHSCHISRSIRYYLAPLIPIAPFSKFAFKLTLTGITTAVGRDPSADIIRLAYVPLLKHYGIQVKELVEVKLKKRGAFPLGGGELYFQCPIIRQSVPFSLERVGKVMKVRGIAATMRISPQVANRLVESTRSVLNTFLNDIYIHTDAFKGKERGNSPGYNLALVAESTEGTVYFCEESGKPNELPENLAIQVAKGLLGKIKKDGVVDYDLQRMILLMIACGPEDLFKVKLCNLSTHTRAYIWRSWKDFLESHLKL